MASSSTADFSESFLHLSLDFTDRLSSADDWTTRSLDDILSYLKLAKLHDEEAAPERPQTKEAETNALRFSSQSTPLVQNTRTRRYSFDLGAIPTRTNPEKPKPSMDAEALFKALQPFLDQYITQNQTSAGGPRTPENTTDHINAAGQKLGESKTQTETEPQNAQPQQTQTEPHPKGSQENQAESSEQKQSPSLPPQTQTQKQPTQKNQANIHTTESNHMRLPYRLSHLDEFEHLDMELRIDDTFDHARRITSDGTIRYGSPGTTPPGSSRDSHFTDSRCTMIEHDDMCKPIAPLTKPAKYNSREFKSAPQVDLPDLTADHIDFELPDEAPDETVAQLKLQLEQYKQDNAELVNEVRFLRGRRSEENAKDKSTGNGEGSKETAGTGNRFGKPLSSDKKTLSEEKESLFKEPEALSNERESLTSVKPSHPPSSEQLTEENIAEEFRPFYRRLQLQKIDTLSDVEKGNVIKNVMLSLLVTDFDHLPSMAPKVGAYLRLTARFLDELHERLYEHSEMRPLLYLRDYGMDPADGLEECLAGMLSKIG